MNETILSLKELRELVELELYMYDKGIIEAPVSESLFVGIRTLDIPTLRNCLRVNGLDLLVEKEYRSVYGIGLLLRTHKVRESRIYSPVLNEMRVTSKNQGVTSIDYNPATGGTWITGVPDRRSKSFFSLSPDELNKFINKFEKQPEITISTDIERKSLLTLLCDEFQRLEEKLKEYFEKKH